MGHFQCLGAQSLNENLLSLLFQRNYFKTSAKKKWPEEMCLTINYSYQF